MRAFGERARSLSTRGRKLFLAKEGESWTTPAASAPTSALLSKRETAIEPKQNSTTKTSRRSRQGTYRNPSVNTWHIWSDSTNEHLRRTLAPTLRCEAGAAHASRSRCMAVEQRTFPQTWRKRCWQRLCYWQPSAGTNAAPLPRHPPCGTACCTAPGHGLFVVQSVARKWENHANLLDRCPVLGDRQRRRHISRKERPQRNRQGAGDACPH